MWFTGPQMSNTLEAQVAEDDNNVNDSDAVCSIQYDYYFFDCPMFRTQRIRLFHDLNLIIDMSISLDVMFNLFNNPSFNIC